MVAPCTIANGLPLNLVSEFELFGENSPQLAVDKQGITPRSEVGPVPSVIPT